MDIRFDGETLWLTQAQIAELFETTPQNVTTHLRAILAEGEVDPEATCKDYLQVRTEGGRTLYRNNRGIWMVGSVKVMIPLSETARMPKRRHSPSFLTSDPLLDATVAAGRGLGSSNGSVLRPLVARLLKSELRVFVADHTSDLSDGGFLVLVR